MGECLALIPHTKKKEEEKEENFAAGLMRTGILSPHLGYTWALPCSSHPSIPGPHHWPLTIMNKMKNFKRRFSLSVPRTETIEESLAEFTEQFNQLHNQRNEGEGWPAPPLP